MAAKSGEHTIASEAITLITEDNMDFNTPTVPQELIADEEQTNKSNGSGSGNKGSTSFRVEVNESPAQHMRMTDDAISDGVRHSQGSLSAHSAEQINQVMKED